MQCGLMAQISHSRQLFDLGNNTNRNQTGLRESKDIPATAYENLSQTVSAAAFRAI